MALFLLEFHRFPPPERTSIRAFARFYIPEMSGAPSKTFSRMNEMTSSPRRNGDSWPRSPRRGRLLPRHKQHLPNDDGPWCRHHRALHEQVRHEHVVRRRRTAPHTSGRYIGPGGGTAWREGNTYLYAYHCYDGDDGRRLQASDSAHRVRLRRLGHP